MNLFIFLQSSKLQQKHYFFKMQNQNAKIALKAGHAGLPSGLHCCQSRILLKNSSIILLKREMLMPLLPPSCPMTSCLMPEDIKQAVCCMIGGQNQGNIQRGINFSEQKLVE